MIWRQKCERKALGDKALESIKSGDDFLFINFANARMVARLPVKTSFAEAVEEVDKQLQRVVTAVKDKGGVVSLSRPTMGMRN